MRRLDHVDISVLMCTYNRADIVNDVLGRLIEQSVGESHAYEIVVVDNGSTDQTKQVVCEASAKANVPIRYLFEPLPSVGRARNLSVSASRGRWLAFIDDDELAAPDWLAQLMSAAQTTGAVIVGGAVLLDLPANVLLSLGRETRRSLRERAADMYGDRIGPCPPRAILGTGNLMLHRDVIAKVGEFDETLIMGGEDADFLMRARSHGIEGWFVPTAVVYHRIPETRLAVEYFKRDSLHSGTVSAMLTARHHGKLRLIIEAAARLAQASLVTVPLMAKAYLDRDNAELLDRRIKLWRAYSYMRHSLASMVPSLALRQEGFRSDEGRIPQARCKDS